jgi:transcriptional regulator with XRE-family HTH domain
MTTMTSPGRVPEFTLGWRMRLALESAGMSVQEMALALGYSRSSVSRWLNDIDEPRAAIMAQWALLTEVDAGWLATGASAPSPTPPGTRDRKADKLANLTEQKRSRTRTTRPGVSTDGYLVAA